MKILITGSNGLLGQKIIAALANHSDIELIATSKGENRAPKKQTYTYIDLDITDGVQVAQVLEQQMPDVVINTAAMTNVDACEDDKQACDALNVSAVSHLVEGCKLLRAHFIQVSTDFIFKGDAGPYDEQAAANPVNYYGQTKWKAEQLVMNSGLEKWSIARTIILYGVGENLSRGNIILWAKDQLEQGKNMQIVDDQFRSPTFAEDLAEGCLQLALQQKNGVFHLSGPAYLSMYHLVVEVAKYWKLDASLIARVKTGVFTQKAERPMNTGFDITKAKNELGYNPHTLQESFAIMASQLGEA